MYAAIEVILQGDLLHQYRGDT